ncbi:hypothetical protein NQ318_015047 [Aromia moschata]|uniref:Condensin complex subunit 1 C-terminal domain-containing protein n=1 Tax=Aromia moschata TaxID=1265417 RepID=A0AAV8YZS9_9CUCU|nr:hypothetical protein NQ318_015047 [Aromia moschata]
MANNNNSHSFPHKSLRGPKGLLFGVIVGRKRACWRGHWPRTRTPKFILNVLENQTVSGSGALAKMESLIKGICKRPDVYDDVMLQGAAVMALSRYMLVSSKFCEQNVQLLFTILEKTAYPEVKCSILVQVSDLLRRFPNVIEPWTPRIYQRLRDPLTLVRQATFFTLAELVLSDMIRVHSHISEMACRMVDEDEGIRRLCKTFFAELSRKETGLYSTLPDIFSHLVEADSISDEQMREIMRFLFGLVSDTKHVGNLVDRFCGKFKLTEDADQHRAIAYCLTLIQYNDKALKNLIENFPTYKHLVHDPEIYGHMKAVMQSCNRQQQQGKKDLKELVAELEKSIRSVFEVCEDGEAMGPPPVPQPRKKKTKKKSTRRKRDSDSEEEDDDGEGAEESAAGTPSTRPNRRRRQK